MKLPEITHTEAFYLEAFWELHTTRSIGFQLGPIPWDKIKLFADEYLIDNSLKKFFSSAIRSMDNFYLDWLERNKPKSDG